VKFDIKSEYYIVPVKEKLKTPDHTIFYLPGARFLHISEGLAGAFHESINQLHYIL